MPQTTLLQKKALGLLLAAGLVVPACGDGGNVEPPPAACSDGIDNDGDVFPDFPGDPGCASADDDDETDNQCNNGIDDDFDGLSDLNDPDCANDPNGTAEANLAAIPDLRMTPNPNNINANVDFRNVNEGDRELEAGCFKGAGQRRVLQWDSIIENVGTADLVVGDTDLHRPVYTDAVGLNQLEFFGWTRSFLINAAGDVVAEGHKGSFCMIDLALAEGFSQDEVDAKFFNCGDGQGISVGVGDVYSQNLECQFIDITDLQETGDFTLRVETNFTKQLPESDYTNNAQDYTVTIN